mgnify:CR=1 FL=1
MISSQRQHLILSRLRTRGAVRITALSKELGVSAMTIRRDIAELADKGLLKRVHGGAVTTSTLLSEPLFSVKSQMDIGLKDAIAQGEKPPRKRKNHKPHPPAGKEQGE